EGSPPGRRRGTSAMSRRRITRRRVLWLGGAAALAPLGAACSGGVPPTPVVKEVVREVVVTATPAPAEATKPAVPAAAAKTSPQQLEIKFSTDFNEGIRVQYLDMVKKRFEEKNPNVKVTIWHMGGGGGTGPGGMTDSVVAQRLTGTAADVIHGWGSMIAERGDSLADISAEVKKYNFNPDDYIWTADRIAHYDKQGRLKAMPFNRSVAGWVYNKTMFDKAGLKAPTEDWTWNDLLQAAKQLTKPQDKEWGVYVASRAWDGGYHDLIFAETGALRDAKHTAMCDGTGPD